MTTYLVDANVLSEPTRLSPNPHVVQWLHTNDDNIVVDPIILGELRVGILSLPECRKRRQLETWFEEVVTRIVCIPWDESVSARWARLVVDLRGIGCTLPLLDSMIVATALQHGLVVATRNVKDFQRAGAEVLNPFEITA